jgi:tetrahydromethanopterin S-methyltransferase subunit C
MNAQFVRRMPNWRSLMWVGVIGSLVTWALAWFLTRGPSVLMVFVALAAVALAYRAKDGNRWAIIGLMVAGFSMFLAALYWFYLVTLTANAQVSVLDVMATSVLPLVFAAVLLLGVVPGFRHAREAVPPAV